MVHLTGTTTELTVQAVMVYFYARLGGRAGGRCIITARLTILNFWPLIRMPCLGKKAE
jgi:hypothetical protein